MPLVIITRLSTLGVWKRKFILLIQTKEMILLCYGITQVAKNHGDMEMNKTWKNTFDEGYTYTPWGRDKKDPLLI